MSALILDGGQLSLAEVLAYPVARPELRLADAARQRMEASVEAVRKAVTGTRAVCC